jgi:hypothetical protein
MKYYIINTIFYSVVYTFIFIHNVPAQTMTSIVDMDFQNIEIGSGGATSAKLGTDGSIVYAGKFSGNGIGTPASVLIGGTMGAAVGIGCDKTATLA